MKCSRLVVISAVAFSLVVLLAWQDMHFVRQLKEGQLFSSSRRSIRRENSTCKSRFQYSLYAGEPATHFRSSDRLRRRIHEYELLHSQCVANSSNCKFVVHISGKTAGIGNKMMAIVSTFVYALLTNRVMLVAKMENVDMLFCEPFPGSGSWLLPDRLTPLCRPNNTIRLGNLVNRSMDFPEMVYAELNNYFTLNDTYFFSQEHQDSLKRRVPWLLIPSDQYFVPGLYQVPSFRQELVMLFPEQESVFHLVARYLLHPSNAVWERVVQYYDENLSQAEFLIGVQVRYHEYLEGSRGGNYVEDISQCLLEQRLLPKTPNNKVAVLVTSLRRNVYQHLQAIYNGSYLALYQPSHEGMQHTGNHEHDEKALMEIYLLSLCNVLLTSPCSTFGYAAQGLKALRPWQVVCLPRNSTDIACARRSSIEPCYHVFPRRFSLDNMERCECAVGVMLKGAL